MRRALALGLVVVGLQGIVIACVIDADSKVLPGKPCPCLAGYSCDKVTQHCVDVPCADGSTVCSGACFDLKTNPSHCGGCNTACGIQKAITDCVDAACVVVGCDYPHADCAETRATCDDLVDTPDACGACGNDCANLFPPPPPDKALRGCRNRTDSSSNIVGVCQCVAAEQCGAGARCDDGRCECRPEAGACVFGEACVDGGCSCGGGGACGEAEACCSDHACHDLRSDDHNCGHCGAGCILGFKCGTPSGQEPRCMCTKDEDCAAGALEARCDTESGICYCADAGCPGNHRCGRRGGVDFCQ